MFNYGDVLDLPLIWGGLIALSVFIYVLLDGFDLGCGILFPFAGSDKNRSRIMNSIAPFWDGNETWLVLGGGGLFAAFPVAYGIIMSGLYLPVIFMLFGLIMRGVAFEFRFKSSSMRYVWDSFFFVGSIAAAFFQGVMLGALITGLEASNRLYAGGDFDWLTPFSLLCGVAVIIGYALLGSTWLIIKTEHSLQAWARKVSGWLLTALLVAMVVVTIATYFSYIEALESWFTLSTLVYVAPLPIIAVLVFILMHKDLKTEREYRPFLLTVALFLTGYLGVCAAIFPYIVPYQMTIYEAAAADTSLSFMLVGALIMLPIILSYTAYAYYTFKGKSDHKPMY
ncbi:cytochrome d ubiquinol oxidase subunit II [Psychrobacter sp. F1192]|uniref:Cytochrome d ubiquinol oxidase subunit II n=1 Tax=Psychrobacter coccoides TaxID=2818440 RepID=A0ABS3NKK3_9GAMM|nr:cytochrome d ubiquinol oxidase subunit II [Psychrobacter coccoides]MBO1529931.1 cytochrome d ubiquinol oxidase subunit II [Psychrobacter coccoides]